MSGEDFGHSPPVHKRRYCEAPQKFANWFVMGSESSSYRNVAISLIALAALGPLGFVFLRNMSYFDGLYMTVITLSTVGFGGIEPLGHPGLNSAGSLRQSLFSPDGIAFDSPDLYHRSGRPPDHAGGRDLAILIEAGDRKVN